MKKMNVKPTLVMERPLELKKIVVACPTCGGNGVLFIMNDEQECHRCEGTGQIEMEV